MSKKIIILMSVYNGERFLKEQLQSIVEQDIIENPQYDLELYIRIDGSNDGSKKIISEFSDKISIQLFEGENIGPAKSFWELLSLAPFAEYYAFSDQDDYWMPNKISRAINYLEHCNKSIPQLYCSSVKPVDVNLNPIAIRRKNNDRTYIDFAHSLIYSIAAGCTFVFNRPTLEQSMKYNMNNSFVEMHDWLMHKIVSMLGEVYFDNNPSLLYRQHNDNVIGQKRDGVSDILRRLFRIICYNRCVRSENAKSIMRVYSEWLDKHPKEKYYLSLICNYKNDCKLKKQLLKEKAFLVSGVKDKVFKLLVCINKV